RHQVHALREVLPRSGHTLHLRLAAQIPLRTDLTSHAGDFRGEGVELVDHDIDRVLQLEDLALDLDGDLLGEVALLNGSGDFGNVANLGRQVGGQLVDVIGQVLPGARGTKDVGLAAEAAFGADLAGHAGDLPGESVELIDHDVDGVLEFGDLAVHINRDLLGKIAAGYRGGDLRDVAHLTCEVAGHGVDVVRQVFPGAGRSLHVRLA